MIDFSRGRLPGCGPGCRTPKFQVPTAYPRTPRTWLPPRPAQRPPRWQPACRPLDVGVAQEFLKHAPRDAAGHHRAERVPEAVDRLQRARDARADVDRAERLAQPVVAHRTPVALGDHPQAHPWELRLRRDEPRRGGMARVLLYFGGTISPVALSSARFRAAVAVGRGPLVEVDVADVHQQRGERLPRGGEPGLEGARQVIHRVLGDLQERQLGRDLDHARERA